MDPLQKTHPTGNYPGTPPVNRVGYRGEFPELDGSGSMFLSPDYEGFTYDGEKRGDPLTLKLVSQDFDDSAIEDLDSAVNAAIERMRPGERLDPGSRVLVTAGSRGISNIAGILRRVCAHLIELGMRPSILGAMGSHGGGTDAGQGEMLASLGITEESVGVPIITSSKAVPVGRTKRGLTVYCDPLVLEVDGIVAVNRVKAHTTARGDIQSGIVKKLVVGLGHRPGAESFHQCGPAAMSEELREMAGHVLDAIPFLGGVGLVENADGATHTVRGIRPEELFEAESELLQLSKSLSPRLPFSEADVLVVRTMGKNFSGTGVDTGVVGRYRVQGEPDLPEPRISRICALDLSEESHGNATGIGLVDMVTRRLASEVDLHPTYTNVLTSTLTMRAMIPMIMASDRDAVWGSVASASVPPSRGVRLAIIENTLDLENLWVSEALAEDLDQGARLDGTEAQLAFDEDGNLISP